MTSRSTPSCSLVLLFVTSMMASAAAAQSKCPGGVDVVRQKVQPRAPEGRTWCWAASAEMAMNYLEPSRKHPQCRQANQFLNRKDCCNFPLEGDCDKPGGGIPPLKDFSSVRLPGALTPNQILDELCVAKRPFLIVAPASGTGSHMMIVIGFHEDTGGDILMVHNPWAYGEVDTTWITLEDYQTNHPCEAGDIFKIKKGPQ